MITWTDTTPDFARMPAERLFPQLTFTLVCRLLLHPSAEVRVVIRQHVEEGIRQHVSEQDVEMGGLILGNVYQFGHDRENFVVHVEAFVGAKTFDGTAVSLRMEPSVWDAARSAARELRFVVGWYHSHPNLGAFFSGTDRMTQRAFFSNPHCLGLVIDPIRRQSKWFLGSDSIELRPNQVVLQRVGKSK